ncbi:MAG: putative Ig domain-containing protein [Planctomycetes bacterium]|nr:putative Ig domain-containing protein [Planctomycetota bacterium]MCW8134508.1 putative Ig domain-containing protein [Planctomycetota bacterium]
MKNSGTAGANEFTRLTLYRDNNADGLVDNGDTELSRAGSSAFAVYFDMTATPHTFGGTASGAVFLVTIDVASGATPGATFDLIITDLCPQIQNGSVQGADVNGNTQTVGGAATPLNITTTTLNDAAVGAAYNETISATGGTGPYTWSGIGIPSFLTLDTAATGLSTTLTGTPAAGDVGTHNFSVSIADSGVQVDTQNYQISVIAGGSGIVIITNSLAAGAIGTPYSQPINSAGGTAPYAWSKTGGTLPPGLNLDLASTGASTTLSGTPTSSGLFSFTVQVTDAGGSASKTLSVSIAGAGGGAGGTGGAGGGGGGGCMAAPGAGLFALALLLLPALRRRR